MSFKWVRSLGILLAFTLTSSLSLAEATLSWSFESLATSLGARSEDCPPPMEANLESTSPSVLTRLFDQRKKSGDRCGASEIAIFLMHRSSATKQSVIWAERAVDELTAAGDFRDATITGLRAISELASDEPPATLEKIRFQILLALASAFRKIGPQQDPQWLEFGLGIKSSASPLVELLMFSTFLRDFPDSPRKKTVAALQDEAVNMYLDRELGIAEMLTTRSEFMGAISRLERLYAFDFVQNSARLSEVLSSVASQQRAFADALLDRPWLKIHDKWTDRRLQYVFGLPLDQPVDRNALAKLLRSKADAACAFLKENVAVPHSPHKSCP